MIKTFSDLDKKMKQTKWAFDMESLSATETSALLAEIAGWQDQQFAPATNVFADYYNMSVPIEITRRLCIDNLDLAYEVFSQGIGDTCQREILIDSLLRLMELRAWPCNGEGEAVAKQFYSQLKEVAPLHGVTLT